MVSEPSSRPFSSENCMVAPTSIGILTRHSLGRWSTLHWNLDGSWSPGLVTVPVTLAFRSAPRRIDTLPNRPCSTRKNSLSDSLGDNTVSDVLLLPDWGDVPMSGTLGV